MKGKWNHGRGVVGNYKYRLADEAEPKCYKYMTFWLKAYRLFIFYIGELMPSTQWSVASCLVVSVVLSAVFCRIEDWLAGDLCGD